MFDAIFRFFFSLNPVVFSQGEYRFAPTTGSYVAGALVLVGAALAIAAYRSGRGRKRDRIALAGIRLAILTIILICLFRPLLVVRAASPQQNFLGVLLDDSRSMQIADVDGQPRGTYVKREFGATDRGLLKALQDRFTVRTFRFSSTATRTTQESDLTFNGSQSRLGAALSDVRQELAGLPVAGLVMVTDGADTADAALGEALLALKAESLPVFTIGVGNERLSKDIQVGRVATPRTALKGTTLMVDVVLSQSGFDGQKVTLDVEDEGTLVSTQQVSLPDAGTPASIPVRFTVNEAGPRVLRFRVSPQSGELVTENNAREALIDVRDRKEKILYFEGEPRYEYKFIRRAIPEGDNVIISSLIRTADNKYFRQGVDGPDELVAGFPKTREELFSYRALIIGSLEAAALTGDQLRMIAEFVDRRGGGLLMLGGPRSLAEGGYAGTAVADVLPVVLDRTNVQPKGNVSRVNVRPTRAGAATAVTQLGPTEAASMEKWNSLPVVTTVNRVGAVKPGATVLLTGTDESRAERPMLVYQRYGRGKTFTFLPQDSWMWQMHASIAVDDLTHENFWRQLLRWLVDGVPDQVEPSFTNERVEPGEAAEITATVVDPSFVELNDAAVMITVTGPDGSVVDVPMSWDGEHPGEYSAAIPTKAPGWYEARLDATRAGKAIGSAVTHFRAAPGDAEYFDATMHAATLRRIAEETGGRFYEASFTESLPDDLRYTGRGVTTVEEHDLWHMPIVLMLLVGLLCAEWGYRRAVGYA
ncbi:MAG TPA: glutamine amidotransferase [Vicinamibacterales bacterium]|nr:glutamine amidotransferase [Vicinamibacterales bacterium]